MDFSATICFVNGTHCPFLDIGSRLYRFRVLNACNARTLRLAFRTAAGTRVPFIVIGNDGGLLPAALRTDEAFLAAAERLDVLLDLRDAAVGDTVVLESLAFDPMHAEVAPAPAVDHAAMGHTVAPADASSTAPLHVHGGGWPEGAARAILALRVRTRITYDRALPTALPSRSRRSDVADARERPFRLGYNKGAGGSTIRVFAMGETPIEVARDTDGDLAAAQLLHEHAARNASARLSFRGARARDLARVQFTRSPIDDRGRLASDFGRKDTVLVWPRRKRPRRDSASRCRFPARRRTCSTATISSMKMAA